MFDFLIVLVLVAFAVAAFMEVLKSIVNAIVASVVKKTVGIGAEDDFPVPSYIWWILGGILSTVGTFFAWKAVLGSEEPMTALLSIVTSGWFLSVWIPLVWWAQMQLDMQVIKKYAVPILKKVLAKKVGVDEDA